LRAQNLLSLCILVGSHLLRALNYKHTLFLPWNECQVLVSLQFVANLRTIESDKDDAAM
jgi:hypothetical protein